MGPVPRIACTFTEQGWSGYDGGDQVGYLVRTDASNIAAGVFALGGDLYVNGEYTYATPEAISTSVHE